MIDKRYNKWHTACMEASSGDVDVFMLLADEELADAEVKFRRKYRLCPQGHKTGLSSNGADYCWTCVDNQRQDECMHESRYYYNPSNLPGDDRYRCNRCGKGMLPKGLATN